MAQVRANFLLLAVFLVGIGLAFSLKYPPQSGSSFNVIHAILIAYRSSSFTYLRKPV